jgi:hypothetical protein
MLVIYRDGNNNINNDISIILCWIFSIDIEIDRVCVCVCVVTFNIIFVINADTTIINKLPAYTTKVQFHIICVELITCLFVCM